MTSPEQRLRERLLGRVASPSERLWGWLGPVIVMVIGGFLRFWHLGRPHQLVFDETYYVKQAYSLLQYGYERRVPDSIKSPDVMFTHGTPQVFGTEPDLVVHPPVGKWLIGLGEHLFGVTSSFGWRFTVALLGTLSILMLARAAWRLFGSALLSTVAAVLLAFEGNHFVHSRTGLLDLIVMFWALAGFCALLVDRDRSRALLARRVAALREARGRHTALTYGPWLGWRPWRWVAGVCLGLSTGTKWSGLFFLTVFGLMTVFWDMGARRAVGIRRWWRGTLVRDTALAAVAMVGSAVVVYLVSWTGWFRSTNGYDRQWGAQHPSATFGWVPDALRSLWHYHAEMYHFHVTLETPHPYQSNPWSWLIQGRPTSFFYEGPKKGQDGCMVDLCSKAITSIGTPTIWWGATIAVFVLLFMWALRRDWRAGAILAGFVGGYLPWFHYQQRTIFSFYEVAFVPWVVLSVVYVLGMALGPPAASVSRRQVGLAVVGLYVAATVALFAFFYPVYTAQVIPNVQWQWRMWFPSWI